MSQNMAIQYRWCLIYYHAGEEMSRSYSQTWFTSLEACKQAADEHDFDYCCGYKYIYEERDV